MTLFLSNINNHFVNKRLFFKANKLIRSLIAFNKCNFQSLPNDESVNSEEIDAEKYRKSHSIECIGDAIPIPFSSLFQYQWHPIIKKRLYEQNYSIPTPIQAQTLPVILEGRDCIGISRSGSGKTLCYVLPSLVKALSSDINQIPVCLVLTPTRELTHQVERVVKKFRFVRSVCLYGGVSREVQTMLLRDAKPHIIISTTGRLCDVIDRAVTHLKHIKYLVIDECDRMLEMGEEKSFRRIMEMIPKDHQTLMFSATFPHQMQQLAKEYLRDYVHVTVGGSSELSLTVNPNIKQIIEVCDESEKEQQLIKCIDRLLPNVSGYNKTIIFVHSAQTANRISLMLKNYDIHNRALHGDKFQPERDYIIREFRRGTIPVIVSTDITSRGLDFQNVSLVINYDYPRTIEDYIHRIGRTARHTSTGIAYTFFTPFNARHAKDLIKVLTESGHEINDELIKLANGDDYESVNH